MILDQIFHFEIFKFSKENFNIVLKKWFEYLGLFECTNFDTQDRIKTKGTWFFNNNNVSNEFYSIFSSVDKQLAINTIFFRHGML